MQDSRQHANLTYAQVIGLIQSGVLDLDDHIAPSDTNEWIHVWELQDAFEWCVVNAYRIHAPAISRMRKSIASNWLTVIEFRDQRDELLAQEPDVTNSAWAARPRPDLINDVEGHELYAAAAIGAARQAILPKAPRKDSSESTVASVEIFRENISKILQGDFPEWANPNALLKSAKTNAFKIFCIALFATIITDPFRPWIHLWWLVLICGVYSIYAALRQLAAVDAARMWVDRFVMFILFTLTFTLLLIVTLKAEPQHGAGILSSIPQVAALQDQLRTQINK
ncbi:MAG: hypothetical protein EXS12_09245 [Phycisphaerales bacterium]|nr:hypothetical protein [Phycisphaerales bacterium]